MPLVIHENNFQSFCLAILTDANNIKRMFEILKIMLDKVYRISMSVTFETFMLLDVLPPICSITTSSTGMFSNV